MAITGTKLWVDETTLYASDMNQYLMRGVKVFADATARDAAYGGAGEPPLEEGEICYLLNANQILLYNGSAWVLPPAIGDDDQVVLGTQIFS